MSSTERDRIVIVGAGPGGIMTGIRLLQRGHTNFVVYEKQQDVGGTWLRNRYPGNACDVPALNYSFSFFPNVDAEHTFEGGRKLQAYFRRLADHYGVSEHVVFDTEVLDARWDGARWQLTTNHEETEADVFVSAVGRLHRPKYPDIEGIDTFEGLIQHSTFWDETTPLEGERLGVIGAGSSGIQIVTEGSKHAARLDFFQRTPQWVFPMENAEIPEETRRRLHEDPQFVQDSFRDLEEWLADIADAVTEPDGGEARERAEGCRRALETVADPELRAKLTPDYAVGCKRLVISGGFYTQVQQENVDVVTDAIERIEPTGVRTADGVLHELDIIILATGFHADSYLRPMTVTGEDGTTLDDIWSDVFLNYKSVTLPHMPNLFTVNGPFSPGGSLSILMVIENHVDYIVQVIDRIFAEDVAIAPDPDRSTALLTEVQERAKTTVWYTGGCTSWYLDEQGVPLVNPLSLEELRADMATPVWEDFRVRPLRRTVAAWA